MNVNRSLTLSYIYYTLRDFFAFAKDIKKYASVRSEYLGTSFTGEIFKSFWILLNPKRTILCYPDRPSLFHVMYKLSALAGFRLSTNFRKNYKYAVWTHNRTVQDPDELNRLQIPRAQIINAACVDTDKRTVGRLFCEIFDTKLDLDPVKWDGFMVKKSVVNGTNDAIVIKGPIPPDEVEDGFVYQKEIDNKNEERESVVYRVPVFMESVPLVFIKYRSEAHRFRGNYHSVEIADPSDLFTKDELGKILEMARLMGMEFGECDVLRDRNGTLYVIDFNNHPGGPPFKMNSDQKRKAGQILADSFEELFQKKEKQLRTPGRE
jgi:hypothetical protein